MQILKEGRRIQIFNDVEIMDKLEVCNYQLSWDAKGNPFLEMVPNFKLPDPLYDVEKPFREMVLKTFKTTRKSVGVLFEGAKGQGKTVTAKQICQEAGIPVIIIGKRIPAAVDFVRYLNEIRMPHAIFIDEFEKLFYQSSASNDKADGYHTQDIFLSMLDGSTSSRYPRLFITTSNSEIGDKFVNRPSRIRYYKKYDFMPEDLYNMIIEDKLKNKQYEDDLRKNLRPTDATTDLLTSVIEEINIHDVPFGQFKKIFNFKPSTITYDRWVFVKEREDFKFKDIIRADHEVGPSTTHLAGQRIEVLKIEGEYIYYRADEEDWLGNVKKVKKSQIYRLKPMKTGDYSSVPGVSEKFLMSRPDTIEKTQQQEI